jgi:thiol:disulfide interchange protein
VKSTPLLILTAIAAAATLVGTACGRPEGAPPFTAETVSNHGSVTVEWENDFPAAIERARSEGKPVLVNFYADWCVWCKRLESTTLRDAKVAALLSDRVVPVNLNVEGDGRELSNRYHVDGLPTILVLDASGNEIGRIPGYMPPTGFLERVEEFLQQS